MFPLFLFWVFDFCTWCTMGRLCLTHRTGEQVAVLCCCSICSCLRQPLNKHLSENARYRMDNIQKKKVHRTNAMPVTGV